MNKGTRILVTVLADMALLALVVFSVHFLLAYPSSLLYRRVFSILIIIAIPAMFLISFTTFAGDKYDYDPDEFEEDGENLPENDAGDEMNDNEQ